jgi:hypothetical protein
MIDWTVLLTMASNDGVVANGRALVDEQADLAFRDTGAGFKQLAKEPLSLGEICEAARACAPSAPGPAPAPW